MLLKVPGMSNLRFVCNNNKKMALIFLVNITNAIRISKTSIIWRTEGKDRTWVLWDLLLWYTWSWVGRCKVSVWIRLQPCISPLCTSVFGFWIKSKYTSPRKRSILAISGNEKPAVVRQHVSCFRSLTFSVRLVLTSELCSRQGTSGSLL